MVLELFYLFFIFGKSLFITLELLFCTSTLLILFSVNLFSVYLLVASGNSHLIFTFTKCLFINWLHLIIGNLYLLLVFSLQFIIGIFLSLYNLGFTFSLFIGLHLQDSYIFISFVFSLFRIYYFYFLHFNFILLQLLEIYIILFLYFLIIFFHHFWKSYFTIFNFRILENLYFNIFRIHIYISLPTITIKLHYQKLIFTIINLLTFRIFYFFSFNGSLLLQNLFIHLFRGSYRIIFWKSIHLEVASESFCLLINSSWLLIFTLIIILFIFTGFNIYCWTGIQFSSSNFIIFIHLFFGFIFSFHFWCRDLLREFQKKYEILLIIFFLLFSGFLISEALLFVSFFWTSFHSLSSPTLGLWPGETFYIPDPCELTFANTLLLSNAAISLGNTFINLEISSQFYIFFTLFSFYLSSLFISLQIKEFRIMALSINDSLYSCLFFFLTGLHFFHLTIGLLLLSLLFWSCSFSYFCLYFYHLQLIKIKIKQK